MRISLPLLAVAAALGLSTAAHADTFTNYAISGTLADGATFSGVFTLDAGAYGSSISHLEVTTTGNAFESKSFYASAGNPLFHNNTNSSGTLYAQDDLTAVYAAPFFYLVVNRSGNGFTLNSDTRLVDTRNYGDAFASGSVAAMTPEPSSFVLLGTGIAGMVGVGRRKFFKA